MPTTKTDRYTQQYHTDNMSSQIPSQTRLPSNS